MPSEAAVEIPVEWVDELLYLLSNGSHYLTRYYNQLPLHVSECGPIQSVDLSELPKFRQRFGEMQRRLGEFRDVIRQLHKADEDILDLSTPDAALCMPHQEKMDAIADAQNRLEMAQEWLPRMFLPTPEEGLHIFPNRL